MTDQPQGEVTFCCGNDHRCASACDCQCHALKAEVARLTDESRTEKARADFNFDENERLRAALESVVESTCEACPDCNGCGNAHDIARDALYITLQGEKP